MMKTEHGKIEGDYEVTDEFDLHGMITGNVTILKHGKLILHGTISKNLTIMKDGSAQIYGTVIGDVNNQGGHLEIDPTAEINGDIFD